VDFTVDTGATEIVLGRRDAEAVGLDPGALRYLGTAMTANGAVRTARVSLERGGARGHRGRRRGRRGHEGPLDSSLLGMTYLNRFSRIEIARGRLVLTR
jgi:aspartyl protease family protein